MTARASSTLSTRGEIWVHRTQGPLDLLALMFLFAFIMLWAFPDAPDTATDALSLITWIVWGAFAVDYVIRLSCSAPRGAFVLTHKLDLVMVIVPMLRLLRVFLVLRKALASISTDKIASSIVSIVVLVVLGSAFLVWRVEFDAPGATITTFREAVWWAVVTTTTVGYGDYTPVTAQGRAIAMLLMIVGIGLIGTISATVASWFVNRPRGANDTAAGEDDSPEAVAAAQAESTSLSVTHDDLLGRLDALAAQQAEIRALLERIDRGS